MQRDRKTYCIYIITNRFKTLYIGVTNNLLQRMWEHKHGTGAGLCGTGISPTTRVRRSFAGAQDDNF